MDLIGWLNSLDSDEKAFASRCIDFWTSTNGEPEPVPPATIGRSKGRILLYHSLSLLESFHLKIKKIKRQDKNLSIRIPARLELALKIFAESQDISESDAARDAIALGISILKDHPYLIKQIR